MRKALRDLFYRVNRLEKQAEEDCSEITRLRQQMRMYQRKPRVELSALIPHEAEKNLLNPNALEFFPIPDGHTMQSLDKSRGQFLLSTENKKETDNGAMTDQGYRFGDYYFSHFKSVDTYSISSLAGAWDLPNTAGEQALGTATVSSQSKPGKWEFLPSVGSWLSALPLAQKDTTGTRDTSLSDSKEPTHDDLASWYEQGDWEALAGAVRSFPASREALRPALNFVVGEAETYASSIDDQVTDTRASFVEANELLLRVQRQGRTTSLEHELSIKKSEYHHLYREQRGSLTHATAVLGYFRQLQEVILNGDVEGARNLGPNPVRRVPA